MVACRRLEKHRYAWSGASTVDCLQSGRLPPGCRWALEARRHVVTTNKGPVALAAGVAEAQTQSDIRQAAGEIEYWLVAYQGEPLKTVHFSRWTSHVAARAFSNRPNWWKSARVADVRASDFIYLNEIEAGGLPIPELANKAGDD